MCPVGYHENPTADKFAWWHTERPPLKNIINPFEMTLKQTEIYQKVKIEQSERRLMQIKRLDLDSSQPAIPVLVDTVKLTAALDTLSDVNAISQTLFDLLDREQEESTFGLRGADDNMIATGGETTIQLSWFNETIPLRVVIVKDLPVPFIIGHPVFRKHRISLNFGTNTVSKNNKKGIPKHSTAMVKSSLNLEPNEETPPRNQPRQRMIKASQTTQLPPLCEQLVLAEVIGKSRRQNGTFVVQGPRTPIRGKPKVARSITQMKDSQILLVLANLTDQPMLIQKGQTLAIATR